MDNFKRKIELQKCKKMADEIADEIMLEPILYDAFCEVVRSDFAPSGMLHHAYRLDALPISQNQWISSPLSVAKMTMALDFIGADNILEIGCGSGYQAAILSKLIRRVFSIERVETLVQQAKERFTKLNIKNIHIRFDDGQKGWREYAPYDRILFSAAIHSIPQTLFDQLKDNGILVAPIIENEKQVITKFIKHNKDNIEKIKLEDCLFVDVKNGVNRV